MLVLGIAGTAKNTGKTTTTFSLINDWPTPETLGLTSIGYDGESKDNVTGLPKPRLTVPAGAVVVTAEKCVEGGSAQIEVMETTDVGTPLGKLVIGRVRKTGLVVLAGPNNEAALKKFMEKLKSLNLGLLLVDGALGRMAPMSATHGLILATGASRTRDLDQLARETEAMAWIFALPQAKDVAEPILEKSSLLVEKQGNSLAQEVGDNKTLEFTGVVDMYPLAVLLKQLKGQPDLVFKDPVKLLLSQDLVEAARLLKEYVQGGGRVMVRQKLPLRTITVNPFYPNYNEANRQYAPGWVDAHQIYDKITNVVDVPVIDVVRQGSEALTSALKLDI